MADRLVDSAAPGGAHETDAAIIGAGPVGLFAVFEFGLLGVRAHVVDSLERPGGQCAELYPEKPILDIPAIKSISGAELTQRLLEQIAPFGATFHLGETASRLERLEDGRWRLATDRGTTIDCRALVIAAGGGSFTPKRPPIAGVEAFEGRSVFYAVRNREMFRDRKVVVAGGGDSALDWTLDLAPIARRVALVHRRDEFRAAPDSVARMRALHAAGGIDLHIGEIDGLEGRGGALFAVRVRNASGARAVPADMMLAFYGLTMKLGPIAAFGLNLDENRVRVDTERFETSEPGIFCIGDMASYPGKLKLILSGFHEAALMAHAAFHYVFPDRKLKFQHTTSAKSLQQIVAGTAPPDG